MVRIAFSRAHLYFKDLILEKKKTSYPKEKKERDVEDTEDTKDRPANPRKQQSENPTQNNLKNYPH